MNPMQKANAEQVTEAEQAEWEFHRTAQRNALGGYIGCNGPACWARIQQITVENVGHKIQAV